MKAMTCVRMIKNASGMEIAVVTQKILNVKWSKISPRDVLLLLWQRELDLDRPTRELRYLSSSLRLLVALRENKNLEIVLGNMVKRNQLGSQAL